MLPSSVQNISSVIVHGNVVASYFLKEEFQERGDRPEGV
jgi:hypothetical protein